MPSIEINTSLSPAIKSTTLTIPAPPSPTTPLSPSGGDVRHVLSRIQFVAHKSANLVHAVAKRQEENAETSIEALDTIKTLLEDIWHATVPLTGAVYFLGQASLLLRNRLYCIVRDVARYLDVVAVELQTWLGDVEPLTPVSVGVKDIRLDGVDIDDAVDDNNTPTEAIPPTHMAIVLDVMLALLEASSGMLAAMSRPGFGLSTKSADCKDAASRSLDRARFQTHMYRPEDEGLSQGYADADRLGFRALEEHVSSLTSYLWCDFGAAQERW